MYKFPQKLLHKLYLICTNITLKSNIGGREPFESTYFLVLVNVDHFRSQEGVILVHTVI